MTVYKCSKCGLAVIVTNTKVIKACNCDAPIVAEASATAKGTSVIKGR